ncbi:serine hydrolase domain-containing protein [Bradyrhizobium sp. 170]|uniref:serine hydrolase domain-containing protein n=1 Tax=Bradyrhizobium sp. 170 TaxID=2782641 RepID=UPI001FFE4292|nr:serine hydrolase domain-containing protein [Bradyrhizobium sp. 170]UPK05835.1 beta-lactamase family protein [Bradyrhizobium sp. 170]
MKAGLKSLIFPVRLRRVAAAFAHGIPTAKPETVDVSSERLARIRTVLQKEVDSERMPGAVVMIARRGQLIYSEAIGFQDKAAGKPMTKDGIFRIYSMTKPLASVGAMMLVEEGKIQLNDSVSKFLPDLINMEVIATGKDGKTTRERAKRRITVHDLFRHTAGLTYGEFSYVPEIRAAYAEANLLTEPSRLITPEQFTAGIAKAPLVREPGTAFEYSLAVDVLGRVIEAVSGQRLSAFLDERLFRPLNMFDTGFKVPEANWSRIAEPLRRKRHFLDVKIDPLNELAGVGGVSTSADYLRFCQMMLNGGALDGRRYVSPTTVKLMTSDHLGDLPGVPELPGNALMGVDGYTFGLGFTVRQGPGLAGVPGSEGEYMWAGHGGTFFWIDPKEELAVVFMAQIPGGIRTYYYRMIKALVAQALGSSP